MSIQNISFSASSKRAKLANAALFISSLLYTLVLFFDLFLSKKKNKKVLKRLTFKVDLIVVYILYFLLHSYEANILQSHASSMICCETALMWDKDESP